MAKRPNSKKNMNEELKKKEVLFDIIEASVKDDFCNYKYEITQGLGFGDVHNVNAKSGRVMDTLLEAFSKFAVHLAVIDDAFKNSSIEIDDIDKFHNHELTSMYHVTGFKIKGGESNESIILIGSKHVSNGHGRMELETPRIAIDNLSSYHWYNELKAAADTARYEVRLYKEGNYIPVTVEEDEEEEKADAVQMKITDTVLDQEFEKSKV